jgi:YbbR domain-containing protein
VSWIVAHWRLKLLSVLLTLGLLGAVAFSENPPVVTNVSVRISYINQPPTLVLVHPPKSIDVRVVGLRDAVDRYRTAAAGVTVDLARARVGVDQQYTATPIVDTPGVTASDASVPIRLTIEELKTVTLDIAVRTPRKSPGIDVIADRTYATCGNAKDRCQVTVSAASSVVDELRAFVNYDVSIDSANIQTSPNEPILFEKNGQEVRLAKVDTIRLPAWTPDNVTVQVVSQGGNQTKTVALIVRPLGTQACGYALTGMDIQPSSFVTVTGPPDAVARIGNSITLDPVPIGGISASQTFTRAVITGSDQVSALPTNVRVSVGVTQSFSCSPPTPTPTPRPSPSPT